jgi:hypothetical protein
VSAPGDVQPTLDLSVRPRTPRAADRRVRGSQSPGPGPVVRTAPHSGALLKHSGHPGETRGISDAPFGGGPVLSRGAIGSGITRRQLCDRRTKPLPPASLTPRLDTRAELRHLCARRRPGHGRGPKWLCPRAQKWLCFVARYQLGPSNKTEPVASVCSAPGASPSPASSQAVSFLVSFSLSPAYFEV